MERRSVGESCARRHGGRDAQAPFPRVRGVDAVGTQTTLATLSTSWQLVTVTYTSVQPSSSTLDFNAYVSQSPAGTCFYADDLAITLN
jgi:hypothetical protein